MIQQHEESESVCAEGKFVLTFLWQHKNAEKGNVFITTHSRALFSS